MSVWSKFKKLNYFRVYSGLPREVYIFFVAKVITCMGMFIMPIWALILTQKIGLTIQQTGLMATIFALTQWPSLIIGGKLIDSIGRKRVLFFCQCAGSFFYIVCALIPMSMLTAVMIIIASNFYTVAQPALDALMADMTNSQNRRASFSLHYFGLNLGYTIAPLIGGLLFTNHLFLLFVLDATTTMISSVLIILYIKEPGHSASEQVLLSDEQLNARTVPVTKVLCKLRELLYFMLVMIICGFCYTQWTFILPLQMASIYQAGGARSYSYLVALNALTVIVFTPLVTALSHRFRPLAVSGVAGICFLAAFITFGIAFGLPLFLMGIFVFTVGEILNSVNVSTFIADRSPATHRGRINSIGSLSHGACQAIAPLIMSNVIALTNFTVAWWVVAALMLTGAVCMFALDKKEKRVIVAANTGRIYARF